MTSIWYSKPKFKVHKLIDTFHGKVLFEMTRSLHGACADLGCGIQGAKPFFEKYTGFDLPDFDIYTTDTECLEDFEIILMNALLDVLDKPLDALNRVVGVAREYIVIHRQEFTYNPTSISKEPAYGGWTFHSRINWDDFQEVISRKFYVVDYRKLAFDNWEDGGVSLVLKKY